MIQHDASYHLWAPAAQEKWYLITSLDDYSRLILYAALVKKETTWTHILALESLFLKYGLPYCYYVDSHSIFRFVQGRDSLKPAQQILRQEIHRYNYQQVHSTTQEIPYLRFQRALEEKRPLFREFTIRPPYKSPKDIFCLRMNRTVDPYRHISIGSLRFKVHADPHKQVNLRIYPLNNQISEIRLWCEDKLIDTQKIKNSELKSVHF